jgi:spore germination protein
MSSEAKDKITTWQATVLMVNYMLAAGVLTLPRTLVTEGKTPDVWISVILGGLVSMVAGSFIVKLSQRFPGQTFFQYNQAIIGKFLGTLVSIVVIVYFLFYSSYEMRSVQEMSVFFLLEGTPEWAADALFMWVAIYLCCGGINSIARICRLIVPITWTIFLGGCLLSFGIFELDNLRPVLGEGLKPVFKAVVPTAMTFTAGENLLFLVAFMAKPSKALKVLITGTSISMFFYTIAVVMSIGAFSVDGVVTRTWPFLDLIRSIEVNFLLFERFESLLLAIWIMQIFCTFCIALYGAALGLSQIMNKSFRKCLYILLPLVYIVSAIPHSINGLFAFGTGLGNGAMLMFGLMPLPLLIIAHFRRAGS